MPAQRHPPADPPNEGVGLVAAEVVPDFGAKDIQDVLKVCVRFLGARLIPAHFFLRLLRHGCNRPGHGPGRQNRVRHAGIDGALRHFGELRAAGRFHKCPAAEGLDLGEAQRAVAARARQHDAAAAPAKIVGEGAQEMVDGHPHPVTLNRPVEGESAPRNIEEPVGRHDMDPVRKDRHPLRGFNHLERSQISQLPDGEDLLRRAGMQDKHIRDAQPGGDLSEKLLERLRAARPDADAGHDDGVLIAPCPVSCSRRGTLHCTLLSKVFAHDILRDFSAG